MMRSDRKGLNKKLCIYIIFVRCNILDNFFVNFI